MVRHRIDGLEIPIQRMDMSDQVRHRIDGLEIRSLLDLRVSTVRHRIDGLEKPCKHGLP